MSSTRPFGNEPLVVGTPYGEGGGTDLVYLDGVTKATASVRIAHETILAAALAVARTRMQGIQSPPPARPDPDLAEALSRDDLVTQGIARNLRDTNAEVEAAFAGTQWANDDPEARADPQGLYLDLWAVDIGPPAVAAAVLSADSLRDLAQFGEVSPQDEPVLVIDAGRHVWWQRPLCATRRPTCFRPHRAGCRLHYGMPTCCSTPCPACPRALR